MSTNLKSHFQAYLATEHSLNALDAEYKAKRGEIMKSRVAAATGLLNAFEARKITEGIKLVLDGITYTGVLPFKGADKSGRPTVRVRMDRPKAPKSVTEINLDDDACEDVTDAEDVDVAAE